MSRLAAEGWWHWWTTRGSRRSLLWVTGLWGLLSDQLLIDGLLVNASTRPSVHTRPGVPVGLCAVAQSVLQELWCSSQVEGLNETNELTGAAGSYVQGGVGFICPCCITEHCFINLPVAYYRRLKITYYQFSSVLFIQPQITTTVASWGFKFTIE